jgi:dienelactone hydrolase
MVGQRLSRLFFVLFVAVMISAVSTAQFRVQKSSATRKLAFQLEVPGDQHWLDSGVDIQPGDRIAFTAAGSVTCPAADPTGPDGLSRGWADLLRVIPLNSAGRGALIARIGDGNPFLVGTKRDLQIKQGGRLFFGINQGGTETSTGSFKVNVDVTPSATAVTPVAAATDFSTQLTPEILKQIPQRIADPDGRPGDAVNFLILGSEDSVRLAFQSAGWVKVDRNPKDAVLHGVLSSISKQAYVEMPMSALHLFGRPQDYGFAHAEPLSVIATRHHLRIWKAPFAVSGQTLWVGAGTHDIGFEKDQRNNGVTHKIDPAIDGERDYIGQSLGATGVVTRTGYLVPPNPIKEARTATGGSFHSDGRILVMNLAASGRDQGTQFADIFCSVLRDEHPDEGQWGDCSKYLQTPPSSKPATLAPLSTKYRVLILPGFLSSCVSSTPAMAKGQEHLKETHGLAIEYLQLPNESSDSNGKMIADYISAHMKTDPRKYIVIGYSKGAPDAQEALSQSPGAASGVAAFVSLAGAIGGSPVANAMPALVERYTKTLNLGSCKGDIAQAAKSLRSDVRHQFLANHPDPVVPTYSLAALSDQTNTSKMLLQAWQILAAYDSEQDSQLTKQDAIVPGSTFLGAARADHLAVALGFEDSAGSEIKSIMDKNHYPRAALLESLVRFVISDLESAPAGPIAPANAVAAPASASK